MKKTLTTRFADCRYGNRKSKIQNLKWLLLATLLLATAPPAQAQPQKTYRIGVIYPGGPLLDTIGGLREGLRELGLAEGKQFTLAIEDIKGDTKAAETAARNFEREKVDLIFAMTSTIIATVKQATTGVPIVFTIGSDPVALGLVNDFARPGGRLTGVQYLVRDLTPKRLEILKEILPKLGRVVTFYNPTNPVPAAGAALAREEAKRLGIKLLERRVKSADELRKGLQALKPGEADAFLYIPDAMVVSEAQLLIDTAKAQKLPTMFHDESLVAKGGLASYGQNYHEIGRLAARHVQRILSGASPKDLKIETVDNADLTINLKTAKELGVNVPAQVLARARRVVK
jgi:putative ABC transport system substrate-binding protein